MDPCVFSPSQQPHNQYSGGGTGFTDSEQRWMEEQADKCKAAFDRQEWGIPSVVIKEGSVGGQVRKSNALGAGIHVALHTNAGGSTGTLIIHYPGSTKGAALANALFDPIAEASDTPDVGIWAKASYYETRETTAPAVIVEYQFHDNVRDAAEIRRSLDEYAEATVRGLAVYYGKTYTPHATAPIGSVWMLCNMPTDQAGELIRQAHSVGASRVLTLDAPAGSMTVLAHVTRAVLPRLRLYCTNRGRTPVWFGAQDLPDISDAQ